jgi:hypothetical protein
MDEKQLGPPFGIYNTQQTLKKLLEHVRPDSQS